MYSMNTQLGLALHGDGTKRPVKIVLFPEAMDVLYIKNSALGCFACISATLEVQLEVNQLCILLASVHHSDNVLEKLSF